MRIHIIMYKVKDKKYFLHVHSPVGMEVTAQAVSSLNRHDDSLPKEMFSIDVPFMSIIS